MAHRASPSKGVAGEVQWGTFVVTAARGGRPVAAVRVECGVHLDGTGMRIAVRPFRAALHRRERRASTISRSFSPPVAATTARPAGLQSGRTMADPFRRAGAVLVEAALRQSLAIFRGGDADLQTTVAAQKNAPPGLAPFV